MSERAFLFDVEWRRYRTQENPTTRRMVAVAKTQHSAFSTVAREASREARNGSVLWGDVHEVTIRFVAEGKVVR